MRIHDDAATPGNHGANAHIVRFYDDEALLMEEVAGFLDTALAAGGAGIVIATAAHAQVLRERLQDDGASAGARIVFLDARAALERLMVGGKPDAQRFRALIDELRAQLGPHEGPLHAFGEMVALLCADGNYSAAIHLEQLWNDLSETLRFSLFCAYPWQAFPDAGFAAQFDQVCAGHQHAGSQAAGGLLDVLGKPLQLVRLERKAQALDAEVARRQEAERALLRRERELADFVENAAEGLHRVGRDGTILWANKAELQMLGYSWDEYVGRHIAEFHVDPDTIDGILSTLLSGGTLIDQPARLRCKDGSVKHVLIHSNGSFEDGKLRYTRCFTRDATERRQRDEALAQRDRMLLNAPMAAALLVGPEFIFRLANRRYCALAGRGALESRSYAEVFPELQGTESMRLLEQVYRTGEPCSVDELRVELVQAGGVREERFLQLNLEPLAGVASEEQGVIVVAVDVTDKVRGRRSLERAHAERERLLDELTSANRAKDEFLAMLGHELRNPLSPIVTALQLMRMRGESGAMREREIIERQVEHLVRLVDDLMDVARATRGQIELKSERVDLAVPLAKAVEMASPLFEQRGHRLAVEVEQGMQWEGDPMRLAQVVSNLLTNAARYTANGGAVTLSARRDGSDWLRIGVLDNGIGLAPDVLPQVFGLFFQGKRSVDRVEGGLGIGLALVKNIVELHGGTVEAHSAGLGHGSEFVVRLPVHAVAPAAAPETPAPVAPAARGCRVMVVDDNLDAAETLGMLLSAHGHTVEVFNDPVSALAAAGRLQPDIAVLDIGLPVMDGYQLATRLRALLGEHPCRLVALSGYGQEADKAASSAAGFERHLVKPITPAQVAALAAD